MKKVIKTTFANIYDKPSFQSQVVTQGIMWEEIEILEKKGDWIKLKLPDGYVGWTQNFFLIDLNNEFENIVKKLEKITIHEPFTAIYSDEILSDKISNAGLSVKLPIIEKFQDIYKVYLPNQKIGFLKQTQIDKTNIRKNIISIAKKFLGTSYQWGGKTEYGIDCSGLVQTIFAILKISMPRDASQQIKIVKDNEIDVEDTESGDLIFFKNENDSIVHVAFSLGGYQFIHSSSEMKINSLDKEDDNFSEKLFNMVEGIYSIEKLL
ncbi:MAG: NlpC/P60 family protein [Candidatus Marinimicrobia bacterium]|nr:NlpC/P60 family protein [Candidatus Neomarinimicrobiota bacterium]